MKVSVPILVAAASLAILASCASTPKPAQTATTSAAPQPQAAASTSSTAQPGAPDAELAQAKDMKATIDKYGLSSQAPDTYQAGTTALSAGEQAMGNDNAGAKSKLDEAIADFKRVMDSGFPPLIQAEQQKVATARADAQGAKADRGAPELYAKAQGDEQQASQKQAAGDYAGTYEALMQAADDYGQSAAASRKARSDALAALNGANAQIDQSTSQINDLQKSLEANQPQTGGQ